MCHEKYHHDPELRAVANTLSGLPSATDASKRQRSSKVAALLLNTACSTGLLDFIENGTPHLSSGDRNMLRVKVKAIYARQCQEALDLLHPSEPIDDVPF